MLLADVGSWPAWYVVALLGFGVLLGVIAAHDARTRRIPNRLVYPGIVAGLILAFLQPTAPWWSYVASGVAAAAAIGALALASGAMGLGDAKLAGLVGLLLGWPATLIGLFAAFALGAVVGVLLMVVGAIGRREPVPFGPALAAGAAIGAVAGGPIAGWLWPGLS